MISCRASNRIRAEAASRRASAIDPELLFDVGVEVAAAVEVGVEVAVEVEVEVEVAGSADMTHTLAVDTHQCHV